MSNVQDNIFQAVESIVSRAIDSTPIDLTITATVATVRNVEIGEYKVTYQGNTFSAFSLDPMMVYRTGEELYVLVPKGDFSSKKIILGKAAFNSKVTYSDRQAMQNQWRTRGPNWLSNEWYWKTPNGIPRDVNGSAPREAHIVATTMGEEAQIVHPTANWREYLFERNDDVGTIAKFFEQTYTNNTDRQDKTKRPPLIGSNAQGKAALDRVDKELQMWGNQLEYILVKADFETAFLSTHTSGEYGILVECYVDNPQFNMEQAVGAQPQPKYNIMTFKLSFGDFNGAPYSFEQPTPQQAVFPVPKGVIKGLVRVSLFQSDGWKTDVQPVSINSNNPSVEDPNGGGFTFEVPPARPVRNRNNISATNVGIWWCEPINLSERLFWIKVDAVKGTSLFNTNNQEESWITDITLQARLMYGAEDVTSRETCKFVWFRQRYSALRDLAGGTYPDVDGQMVPQIDNLGNTWAHYLPEGENGWAPIGFRTNVRVPGIGGNPSRFEVVGLQWPYDAVRNPLGEGTTGATGYKQGTFNDRGVFRVDDEFQDVLQVDISEVPWEWRYMVVCYYNPNGGSMEEIMRSRINDALIWEVETVRNLSSIHDFELPMVIIGDNMSDQFLRVRNNTLPWVEGVPFDQFNPQYNDPQRDWWCRWWVESGQTYMAMEGPDWPRFHKGKRLINHYLLNEPITFKCQIYGKKTPVGSTAQARVGDAASVWRDLPSPPNSGLPTSAPAPNHTLENNEYEIACLERAIIPDNSAAVHVEFIGQRTHNYNANGKIRLAEMADTQWNIRAKITPRDNSITVFGVEWLAPDRTPLRSLTPDQVKAGSGYTPQPNNSMLRDMWMSVPNNNFDQRNLHYKVADTYDIDKVHANENTFILRIEFLNGNVQEVPCEINYTKADGNGSQGSEWTAQIWPCNATETLDGINAVGYTPWTRMIQEHPRPLVVNGNWDGSSSQYTRDSDYRLFLRPFVRRNGEALEAMNESSRYSYKVFWDVRYPNVRVANSARGKASFGSFLEFATQPGAGGQVQVVSGRVVTDLGKDGNLATGVPNQKGPTVPDGLDNLQAYTHSRDRQGYPYNGAALPNNAQPTFGAIEVRWANRARVGENNDVRFNDLSYSFIVKAQIDIYYSEPDGSNPKPVASITSFHGVDILFTNNRAIDKPGGTLGALNWSFVPSKVKTNWPKEAMYTSTGIAPVLPNKALEFFYGDAQHVAGVNGVEPITATPVNLTPGIQELNRNGDGLNHRGPYSRTATYSATPSPDSVADAVSFEGVFFAVRQPGLSVPTYATDPEAEPNRHQGGGKYWRQISDYTNWKLIPRAFYFFEEADNGALRTDITTNTGKWPPPDTRPINPDFADWGTGASSHYTYVRTIVYFISQFGNDQINGWDGKSIDLNEEEGTIFAPTIGAGWKHPFRNTFSGVIMGIDKSQKKSDWEPNYGGFSEDNQSQNPYMTGLFGYQDGVNSFGIMENGTAFFGRADRGGRIIIDGFNAQIYGGVTVEKETGLEANMRNRMRLSFIDFGGAAATAANLADPNFLNRGILNPPPSTPGAGGVRTEPTPGLAVDGMPAINLGAFDVEQPNDINNSNPAPNRWFGNFRSVFAPGVGNAGDGTGAPGEDPLALYFGGFASGHGFSTPAIEIGSYEDWVKTSSGQRIAENRPQFQIVLDADANTRHPWRAGKQLVRQYTVAQIRQLGANANLRLLEIPGFRRFLVTYDGTLYAMNAFIMGTIMGSNIIGSQFFTDTGDGIFTNYLLGLGPGGPATYPRIASQGFWSYDPPTTYQFPTEDAFIEDSNAASPEARNQYLQGGRYKFAVSREGVVIASRIHITGGSISIGSFHVIGYSRPESQYQVGDVISFGTLHLVGKAANSGNATLGEIALNVYGDSNFRGRFTSLGPTYMGSSPEKQFNSGSTNPNQGVTRASSFNSPMSIVGPWTPHTGGTPNPDLSSLLQMSLWPLYFNIGTAALTEGNDVWVGLASNPTLSTFTAGMNNGYMPAFSLRTADIGDRGPVIIPHNAGENAGTLVLPRHVLWRLDQLGMWTDGLMFSRMAWIQANASFDRTRLTPNQVLLYMGWMEYPNWAETGYRGGFGIRNVSNTAPNIVMETIGVTRLGAGRGATRRGVSPSTAGFDGFTPDPAVVIDSYQFGNQVRRGAVVVSGPKDAASVNGANVVLTGLKDARNITGNDWAEYREQIECFVSLNGIGWEAESTVNDERGRIAGFFPGRATSGNDGYIWIKSRTTVLDCHSDVSQVTTTSSEVQVRLNRTYSGNPNQIPAPNTGENTPAIQDVLQGALNCSAGHSMNFSVGNWWRIGIGWGAGDRTLFMTPTRFELTNVPPEEQFGIYARFAP